MTMMKIRGLGAIILLLALMGASAIQESDAQAEERSPLARSASNAQAQVVQLVRLGEGRAELSLKINGEPRTLVLRRIDVWASNAEVLIDLGGGELESRTPLDIETYRGTILGAPASRVAISADPEGALRGLILDSSGEMLSIVPAGAAGLHEIREAQAGEVLGLCDTDTSGFVSFASNSAGDRVGSVMHEAEIAFDADREYYVAKNQSVPQVEASIVSLVNAANLIFERDANVTHRITTIIVRTAVNDPYGATTAPEALDEFRTYWNANHITVQRDTAHLITGRTMANGIIGRAFLGSMCARTFAYGFSNITFSSSLDQQTILLAHEVAHNWNAPHCDVSPGDCHIMCSLINACDGAGLPNFAPSMAGEIMGLVDSVSCLDLIASECTGDADGSGVVDFGDITMVLSHWLTNYGAGTGVGDADSSGEVNFADITAVLGNWLSSCP